MLLLFLFLLAFSLRNPSSCFLPGSHLDLWHCLSDRQTTSALDLLGQLIHGLEWRLGFVDEKWSQSLPVQDVRLVKDGEEAYNTRLPSRLHTFVVMDVYYGLHELFIGKQMLSRLSERPVRSICRFGLWRLQVGFSEAYFVQRGFSVLDLFRNYFSILRQEVMFRDSRQLITLP